MVELNFIDKKAGILKIKKISQGKLFAQTI